MFGLRRSLIVCYGIASLVLSQPVSPLLHAEENLENLPLQGPAFQGREIPLKPQEQQYYEGAKIVKREYTVDGRDFFITILDGTDSKNSLHDPYQCFTGSGWEIASEKDLPLKNGEGGLLEIRRMGQTGEALFWYSDGTSQHHSPRKYWWQSTLGGLTFGLLGKDPILIVIQPLQEGNVDWDQFKKAFPALFEI